MKSFKKAAIQILTKAGQPLHYQEITKLALQQKLIASTGKTPWATMNALLSVDIKQKAQQSPFVHSGPGYFSLQNLPKTTVKAQNMKSKAIIVKHQINSGLNTKEKGDIAEWRVAELITLYCREPLFCYGPITDSEGIDLIVKKGGSEKTVFVQVKSTFGFRERGFVCRIKETKLVNKSNAIIVFVYFDLSEGDLYEQIFCIPVFDFLNLTRNNNKKNPKERIFSAGLKRPDKSKFAPYMIEKRELANKILEIMNKI